MTPPYTHAKLTELENFAERFGLQGQMAHFGFDAIEAKDTGFALHIYEPGAKPGFGHKHQAAEEIYVVTAGSGQIKLDDEVIDVARHDAVRVAPEVTRAFAAGPDGMEIVAFGARKQGDGEAFMNWWT